MFKKKHWNLTKNSVQIAQHEHMLLPLNSKGWNTGIPSFNPLWSRHKAIGSIQV